MKRTIYLVLCLILSMSLLSGCANYGNSEEEKLSIVTTIFPEYDWVRQIMGDRADIAELTLLLDNSVDLHSYQPTADDLVKISNCDLFVYVGGESDDWLEKAISGSAKKDRITVNLLDVLGSAVKEEETVEGMQAEDEEGTAPDEHVWLSLNNAAVLCGYIADKLCALDPDGKDVYTANVSSYVEKLRQLDREFEIAVGAAPIKTLLFADRFPFRYLTEDYGLSYYAAFAGCSAETEAGFDTIVFLANKADELRLPVVLAVEGSDGKLAQTVIDTTQEKNARILRMDSMQSVTSEDVRNGAAYLSAMEKNLAVLKAALGVG